MVCSLILRKDFYIVADVNPGKVILKSALVFYFQSCPHPTPLLGRGTDYLIGGKKYFQKGVGGGMIFQENILSDSLSDCSGILVCRSLQILMMILRFIL